MSIVEWVPHTVMSDENIYQWNRPHSCAFVKGGCRYSRGGRATLKYHPSQCNTATSNAQWQGVHCLSVFIKGTMPPGSLIVPSWMCFHKWPSLTSIYPSALILEATSSRKAFLTNPWPWTHQAAHPLPWYVRSNTAGLCIGGEHSWLMPLFPLILWGPWGRGHSHLVHLSSPRAWRSGGTWAKERVIQGERPPP